MIQPEKIDPGKHVYVNSQISQNTHQKLRHLRHAVNYRHNTNYDMREMFQIAIEQGIIAITQQVEPEPSTIQQ